MSTPDTEEAILREIEFLDVTFPEYIVAEHGNFVYQDYDGYFEMLPAWRAARLAELKEQLVWLRTRPVSTEVPSSADGLTTTGSSSTETPPSKEP